jgi:hypothetical protein
MFGNRKVKSLLNESTINSAITQIGCNAINQYMSVVPITRNFAYACWLFGEFSVEMQGWITCQFVSWYDLIFITLFSTTQGLWKTLLPSYKITDCTWQHGVRLHVPPSRPLHTCNVTRGWHPASHGEEILQALHHGIPSSLREPERRLCSQQQFRAFKYVTR